MKPWGWPPLQYDCCQSQRKLRYRHAQLEEDLSEDTGEKQPSASQERGLRRNYPADTWPPDDKGINFCWWSHPVFGAWFASPANTWITVPRSISGLLMVHRWHLLDQRWVSDPIRWPGAQMSAHSVSDHEAPTRLACDQIHTGRCGRLTADKRRGQMYKEKAQGEIMRLLVTTGERWVLQLATDWFPHLIWMFI